MHKLIAVSIVVFSSTAQAGPPEVGNFSIDAFGVGPDGVWLAGTDQCDEAGMFPYVAAAGTVSTPAEFRGHLTAAVASGAALIAAVPDLVRSIDHGAHWTKIEPTEVDGLAMAAGVDIAVGKDGISRSTDDGATWTKVTAGTNEHLRGVAGDGATFVAVGDNGTVIASSDAGATWAQQKLPAAARNARLDVAWVGPHQMIATGASAPLLVAEIGKPWRVWATKGSGFRSAWGTGHDRYVLGGRPVVSHDDGTTWKLLDGPLLHAGRIAGTADDLYAARFDGEVVHTTDRGATWMTAQRLSGRRCLGGRGNRLLVTGP